MDYNDFEKFKRENDITVDEFIKEAKYVGLTKKEAYKWIDKHNKSLEDDSIPYEALSSILLMPRGHLTEEGYEKLMKSWGDDW